MFFILVCKKRGGVHVHVCVICLYVYSGLSCRVAGHQGSTQSDLCVATGVGPFNLPTRGSLQRGGTTPIQDPGICALYSCCAHAFVYFPGLWDELCVWHVTRDYSDDVCC